MLQTETKPLIMQLSEIAFNSKMYTESTINDWVYYFQFLYPKGMVEVKCLDGIENKIIGFLAGFRSNKYRSHVRNEVPPLPVDPTAGKFLYVVCAWVQPSLRGTGVMRSMFKNAMKKHKGVQFLVWENQKRRERRFIGKWAEAKE